MTGNKTDKDEPRGEAHRGVAKFRLKLKKVGKTTRPFRYDLNQIPYDYTTPVFLPGESHGRRSLVGCIPWGRTESDMTEST